MTSINQIFFQGGPQLGEVRAGLAASAWGVPFAIISGGIWTIIAALLILAKWPAVRQYDTHEPAPQPAPATTDQASGRLHSNHPKKPPHLVVEPNPPQRLGRFVKA